MAIVKHSQISFIKIIFATFSLIMSQPIPPNPDSEALLQLKKSFTNIEALDSWKPGTEPCGIAANQWVGLVCENGMVTGLRLAKMGLSGKIDVDALLKMPNLRSLSITNNSFGGPIPELNKMGSLKGVYLSANEFSGEIPSTFFSEMASLRKLWLSENNFSGPIPLSLAQISHLISVHLANNHFSGAIPEFQQTTLISLDLSNNNLEGAIPPSLSKFNASSFSGNAGLCGDKLGKPCNSPKPTTHSNSVFYALMVLSALILLIMGIAIFVMRRKQQSMNGFTQENLDESIGSAGWRTPEKDIVDQSSVSSSHQKSMSSSRKGSNRGGGGKGIGDLIVVNDEKGGFGLPDLMKAAAEVLGNGSVGASYKAMMSNGFIVVVKRVKEMNKLTKEEFDAEITRMAGLKHPNILTPLAYHYRKEEKLIVSEYIPKGSLLYVLHGDRGACHAELNWPVRLKIVKGIARGLSYLHNEYAYSDLPHGDLKSSNVLLMASNYEPLLADYGLNSFISNSVVAQTLFAYKSPEVSEQNNVSSKCDVYCLGIIILEVITGKFPSQYRNHGSGGTDVVEWAKSAVQDGREFELVDPEIVTAKNALGEMQRLLQIGAACTESSPEKRLDIREATKRIEQVQVQSEGWTKTADKMFDDAVPTLRDGYADAPTSQGNRPPEDSYGDQVLRQNGDSFAFHRS